MTTARDTKMSVSKSRRSNTEEEEVLSDPPSPKAHTDPMTAAALAKIQLRPPRPSETEVRERMLKRKEVLTKNELASLNPSPVYRQIASFHGHTRSITALSFSPEGSRLLSCGTDKVLKIWSIRTGQAIHTLRGHTQGINDAAWSKCGRYVASVSDEKRVIVWNSRTGEMVKTLLGHTSYVFCVAFNPSGTLLATGAFDETIKFWDLRKGEIHRSINAHTEAVSSIDFNKDGTVLVSGSYDGLIRLWDVSTGQCLKTLVADLSGAAANVPIAYVTFSPSSEQLLACTLDETVRLWDVMNGKVMKTYTGHSNLKYATKAAFTYPRFIEPGPATEADIHFPEKAELTPEERHEITQKLLSRERRRRDRKGLPEVLIAIGSENQKVYLWDLQTKEIVQELEGHRDVILGLAVHPFLPIIASGSMGNDPSIRIWLDVGSGESLL